MEHPAKGADDTTDVVPQRLEVLYPEFLAAVLDGISEDTERMAKYRSDLNAAYETAKRKAAHLLKDWTSAQLEGGERSKIAEASALFKKADGPADAGGNLSLAALNEALSLCNKALAAIEETRQLYLARLEEEARRKVEEEEAQRTARKTLLICIREEGRRKAKEEEARRKAEEERIRRHAERMTSRITYCLQGLTAVVVLLAAFMHWTASALGLLASFFPPFLWRITPPKNRPWTVILGIVGYLAIPTPLVPIILHQPHLVGILVGIAMVFWLIVCCIVVPLTRGHIWARFLVILPFFANLCDWSELDGGDWAKLLRIWPRFASKCDWSKLDGLNWATLLGRCPQFADKCDWTKLGDLAWGQLLQSQPQFASRRGK